MQTNNQKSPLRPQQGNNRPTNRVAVSPATSQAERKSSYLSDVKRQLFQLVLDGVKGGSISVGKLGEDIWAFVQPKIAQSYWNGVEAGASGRVRPKKQTP